MTTPMRLGLTVIVAAIAWGWIGTTGVADEDKDRDVGRRGRLVGDEDSRRRGDHGQPVDRALRSCQTRLTTAKATVRTCAATLAAAQRFPASGQTTCWDSSGTVISCAGTGQDGDIQAGATLSYTDNDNGTITDNNTKLVWEKKSADDTIHDRDRVYTWANAFAVHIASLNIASFAGHSDWRVPNFKELLSIMNFDDINLPVSPAFNTGCVAGCTVLTCSCPGSLYWSSNTWAGSPAEAFVAIFSLQGGQFGFGDKSGLLSVRAVRGGL